MVSKIVVIVGETGSGKSALAMELAKRFDGEIICADSRTVYRQMDIGTAKPTKMDRAAVPHHLVDVVEPNEPFNAADFKRLANKAIKEISSRNKLPILVGGSGLYIDALLFDYSFAETDSATRDSGNPRHLAKSVHVTKSELRPQTCIIGLHVERDALRERIHDRVEHMVKGGLVEEVRKLLHAYGRDCKALQAPGYKAFAGYLDGSMTLEAAKAAFVQNDLNLAKRQRTWFKRNKYIHWLHDPRESVEIVTTFLNT